MNNSKTFEHLQQQKGDKLQITFHPLGQSTSTSTTTKKGEKISANNVPPLGGQSRSADERLINDCAIKEQ